METGESRDRWVVQTSNRPWFARDAMVSGRYSRHNFERALYRWYTETEKMGGMYSNNGSAMAPLQNGCRLHSTLTRKWNVELVLLVRERQPEEFSLEALRQ